MKGRITKGLEWEMLFLQPQTLLVEVTRVRHPSVLPVAITIYLRYLVAVVSTVTAYDILLGIVEWCLGMIRGHRETNRTKLWLLMGVRVVGTNGTKLGVGYSCWEQRKLARWNGYSKRKPKMTKPSTGWKRQSQSEAK
ncbi:hypothetical protein Tco_0400464, partial [Tanacetum coccineum]